MKHQQTPQNNQDGPRPLFVNLDLLTSRAKKRLIFLLNGFMNQFQQTLANQIACSNPQLVLTTLQRAKVTFNILNDPELLWTARQIEIICISGYSSEFAQKMVEKINKIIGQIRESLTAIHQNQSFEVSQTAHKLLLFSKPSI